MAYLAFVIGNWFAALLALRAARSMLGQAGGWRLLVLALALFPVSLLLVLLVVGSVGLLNVWVAVGVLGSALAVLWRWGSAEERPPAFGGQLAEAGQESDLAWRTTSGGLLAGLLGVFGAKALLGATDFSYDDLMYHAVAPAYWLTEGGFSVLPFNWEASYYPMNCELVSIWLMLPFRGDGLVGLTSLLWLLLASAAIGCLAHAAGCSRGTALFAAVPFLLSNPARSSLDTFSGTDVGGVAFVLAAAAVIHRPLSRESSLPSGLESLAAGLLVGFAAGSKAPFVAAAAVMLIWLVAVEWKGTALRARARKGTLFLLGAVATGSYWYLRTTVLTGNPVFPAEIGPLQGPLSTPIQLETSLAWKLLVDSTRLQNLRQFIDAQSSWPVACLVLGVMGYANTAIQYVLKLRRRQRVGSGQGLLVAVGLASLVLGAVAPFSGSINDPEAVFSFAPRYFLLPFAIGLVLFVKVLDGPRRRHALFWRAFSILCVALCWGNAGLAVSLITLVAGTIGIWWGTRSPAVLAATRSGSAQASWVLLALFIGVAMIVPAKQDATDRKLFRYTWDTAQIGGLWSFVETLDEGARIAWFAAPADFYYPLFGRRLQHRPVVVDSVGRREKPMHERWKSEEVGWWEEWYERWQEWYGPGRSAIDSELVANLQAEAITHVVVSKWPREVWPPAGTDLARRWGRSEWPPQTDVLSRSAEATEVFADGTSRVFAMARGQEVSR